MIWGFIFGVLAVGLIASVVVMTSCFIAVDKGLN